MIIMYSWLDQYQIVGLNAELSWFGIGPLEISSRKTNLMIEVSKATSINLINRHLTESKVTQ